MESLIWSIMIRYFWHIIAFISLSLVGDVYSIGPHQSHAQASSDPMTKGHQQVEILAKKIGDNKKGVARAGRILLENALAGWKAKQTLFKNFHGTSHKPRVLVVCLANTCRSPAGADILRPGLSREL